jgi:signal transduction histidine kinase
MKDYFPHFIAKTIAKAPCGVCAKLIAAFMVIVFLLIMVGAVGFNQLNTYNQRSEQLVTLHRKTAAFRQLQHDTTSQLYYVSTALIKSDERELESVLRQLHQFRYDFERVQFVTKGEAELFGNIQNKHNELVDVITQVVELTREGKLEEALELRVRQVVPLADRLERLTNEIVNRAEAGMLEKIDETQQAYRKSRQVFIGIALGSIGLAIFLGYAISVSLMVPVEKIADRLQQIASGDFSKHVTVSNKDELGTLADNLNRMNDELSELYIRIESANRHKSEFLAHMSHELRTPLNAVIGFSQMLEQQLFGELNEKQMEYVQDIHSSGQHLLSLINDILDLSKIDAGRMELDLSEFEIPLAIENALTLIKERAGRHGIAVSLEVDKRLNTFTGDERKFKQILLNLLSNAVKFTPDGGSIVVNARLDNGNIEIAVSDTGVGISPEDQAGVFEEFHQVRDDVSLASEGTGLGLTLTKRFVELHGGRIWVKSALGEGSTFTFVLPEKLCQVS